MNYGIFLFFLWSVVLYNSTNEWTITSCNNMDESHEHNIKQKK